MYEIFLQTAREGHVFTSVCLFTGGWGLGRPPCSQTPLGRPLLFTLNSEGRTVSYYDLKLPLLHKPIIRLTILKLGNQDHIHTKTLKTIFIIYYTRLPSTKEFCLNSRNILFF